jgi:nucleotide-binding universal stress UspA family protein
MNTRGLMELIVLNIGLDLGVISPTLFTMMVVMALVTTVMTTPLLRWIYPPEEMAKDQVSPAPVAPPVAALPFTVLMCVSHEQAGSGMVTLGRALSGMPGTSSQLYALHLIPPAERASFLLRHGPEKAHGGTLTPLVERASKLGLEVRPLSFVSAEPGRDICRTAEAKQASLILLGWHKPLFGRTMLGGTVSEVMQEAGTDVAVLVDRGLKQVRKVLVPFIGSPHDRAALGLARRLLGQPHTEVTVLHVTRHEGMGGHTGARPLVEELFPEGSGRVHFKVVSHESPEEAALEECRNGYDLVVAGVGAEWGLEEKLFGLRSERILQESPASLLIVRHSVPATAAELTLEEEAARALTPGSAAS